jgi:hypothetical protein
LEAPIVKVATRSPPGKGVVFHCNEGLDRCNGRTLQRLRSAAWHRPGIEQLSPHSQEPSQVSRGFSLRASHGETLGCPPQPMRTRSSE